MGGLSRKIGEGGKGEEICSRKGMKRKEGGGENQ